MNSNGGLPTNRRGDRTLLRLLNSAAALRRLREGQATAHDLAVAIGVSRTAAQQIADELVESRWVDAGRQAELVPQIGRTPRFYRFRTEVGFVARIDISRHRVTTLLSDLGGSIVARADAEVSQGSTPTERFQAARESVDQALQQARVRTSQLWVVSAGTRGVVDNGVVTKAGGMNGWTGIDLAAELSAAFDREVLVENDSALAAIAERWVGAGQGVRDLVTVEVGRSIGAGIIVDGKLHRGFGGFAAEIHHLPFLKWRGAASLLKSDDAEEADLKAVFDAARDGDAEAIARIDHYARALAEGIAVLVGVLDPELVILGGGVSRSGSTLADAVRPHLAELAAREPRLIVSDLGDQATALGAVRAALNHVDTQLEERTHQDGRLPLPQRRQVFRRTALRRSGSTRRTAAVRR